MIERSFWQSFLHILCDSIRPLRFVTMWIYAAVAGSFIYAGFNPHFSSELCILFRTMPWWGWALLSAYVAVARWMGLFIWKGLWITRRTTPVIGMIVWAFLFTGAGILTPIDGMAVLYVIPMFIEVWILGRTLAEEAIPYD